MIGTVRTLKLRAILSVCLLVLALAGCAGGSAAPTSTSAPDVPSPTTTPEDSHMPSPAPDPTPTPEHDDLDSLPQPVRIAVSQAAAEAAVPEDEVRVVSYEERAWPSTALGCPRPGFSYAQVVTDGFEVIIEAGGTTYEFHTNLTTSVVLCTSSMS